ncbi:MAG TPA: hypothetical protein VFI31_09770 [Pirellulales bacterium]|nr:hypothetical protein [Pirellulales bacterium]
MSARPQFSLRILLFVMAMVCLAAGSAAPLPLPPERPVLGGGVGWSWSDMGFAIHTQALLRSAACLVFPAVLVAGAVARGGAVRLFCVGALFPTILPLAMLLFEASESAWYVVADARVADAANTLGMSSHGFQHRITALWIWAACSGFACALYGSWLRLGQNTATFNGRKFAARWLVAAMAMAALAALMIQLPAPAKQGGFIARIPLRTALCTFVPGALAAGAIEGRDRFRIFSAGAAILVLMPLILMWGAKISEHDGQWEPSWLFDARHFIAGTWALALLFGGVTAFFHWLFQRGESNKNAE